MALPDYPREQAKAARLLLEIQKPFMPWVLPLATALGLTLALVVEQQKQNCKSRCWSGYLIFGIRL
jgi:hypothetical protein